MTATGTVPLLEATKSPRSAANEGRNARLARKGGGLFFALGLSSCVAIQYVVMRAPEVLPWLYVGQIIPLLIYRGITYHMYVSSALCLICLGVGTFHDGRHWGHYTVDLCYFVNSLLIIYICLAPSCDWLFIICFGLCNGPVLIANIVFRCSMVLSDIQRFISWYMHVIPGVVIFTIKWLPVAHFSACRPADPPCLYDRSPSLLLLLSASACVLHSLFYHLYVWRLAPAATRDHPAYQNSFIYLTQQWTSGPLHTMLHCFGTSLHARILSLALINQGFNLLCIGLTYAAWYSLALHLTMVLVVTFITAYYAGSYYDHVESKADAAHSHSSKGGETGAEGRGGAAMKTAKVVPLAEATAAQPGIGTRAGGSLEEGHGATATE